MRITILIVIFMALPISLKVKAGPARGLYRVDSSLLRQEQPKTLRERAHQTAIQVDSILENGHRVTESRLCVAIDTVGWWVYADYTNNACVECMITGCRARVESLDSIVPILDTIWYWVPTCYKLRPVRNMRYDPSTAESGRPGQ